MSQKVVNINKKYYLCRRKAKERILKQTNMKRITIILACLMCTIMLLGEEHLMFRSLPIDGELKTAVKTVKKWGFMGMKIQNVAALVGTLEGEDVLLTLMATPESKTLFSVTVIYEGANQWEESLAKYQSVNAAMAAQYGEPSEVTSEWESPYSMDNNPVQAFKEGKATHSCMYTAQGGKVVVSMVYIEDKICTIVAYIDEQNASLYKAEGGTENIIDENATPDIEE